VRNIVEGAYNHALELLRQNLDKLQLLATTLLEREMLDGDQMNRVLRGEKLEPLKPVDGAPERSEAAPAPSDEAPRGATGIDPFPPPAPRPAGA
jgi:hypothetical protein